MKFVDVCVATYRRPELLVAALQSLRYQDLDGVCLSVVIIDNDFKETARATVDRFREVAPFGVTYDVEPVQNISMARNRGLSHVSSDYVVFMDDDESATPTWLANLLSTMTEFDADVVFGPVQKELPLDAPDWANVHQCFQRRHFVTGAKVMYGATNNVLIRTAALGSPR